jgi:hypothetical protein
MPTDGRAGRQTDMTKLTVAFHNFGNAPKKKDENKITRQIYKNGTQAVGKRKLFLYRFARRHTQSSG